MNIIVWNIILMAVQSDSSLDNGQWLVIKKVFKFIPFIIFVELPLCACWLLKLVMITVWSVSLSLWCLSCYLSDSTDCMEYRPVVVLGLFTQYSIWSAYHFQLAWVVYCPPFLIRSGVLSRHFNYLFRASHFQSVNEYRRLVVDCLVDCLSDTFLIRPPKATTLLSFSFDVWVCSFTLLINHSIGHLLYDRPQNPTTSFQESTQNYWLLCANKSVYYISQIQQIKAYRNDQAL